MAGKRLGLGGWTSLATLYGCLLVAPVSSMAQSGEEVPRTSWGAPALGGIWDYRTATPLQRPKDFAEREFFTEEEAAEFGEGANARQAKFFQALAESEAESEPWFDVGDRPADGNRTALIVDPPHGRIPELTELGKERIRDLGPALIRQANGPEDRSLEERCLTFTNVPIRILPYNNNVHIFQTPDTVAILSEMMHEVRVIPLDRPPPNTSIPQWLGNSRGRWEGETLVIETTGFDKRATFEGSGPTLRLIERLTRVDVDTLRYQYTVDDAESFTRPWTVDLPMKRSDAPLFEYACHEGNRGIVNILSFARAEEQASPKSPP